MDTAVDCPVWWSVGSNLENGAQHDRSQRQQAGSLFERLRFAGLETEQTDFLRKHRETLLPEIENGLKALFARFQSSAEASAQFDNERQLDRLHSLMSSHWAVLSDARFDSLYAERVKVLSDTEGRMGLDPRWHIAGHAVVLEHLVTAVVSEASGSGLLPSSRRKQRELADLVGSLIRLVMVDVEIAVSLRFNELRLKHHRDLAVQRTEELSSMRFSAQSSMVSPTAT